MMDFADRCQLGFSYLLRGSLVVAMGAAVWTGQWTNLFLSLLILILTFLPAIISRNYKVYLPVEFDLIIVIFIYASLYLGEIQKFYLKFWWWDVFLHATAALVLGFVAFLIVYIISHERRLEIHLVPKFVGLFSFAFALSLSALWEVFEYTMDRNFGTNMQKSGLQDTMWDLITDALGAVFSSFLGYLYITRKSGSFFFRRLIDKFQRENPDIFQKKPIDSFSAAKRT